MTMQVVEQNNQLAKPMYDMEKGEVCKVVETGEFVLAVGHMGQNRIYLILYTVDDQNSYGHNCSKEVVPLLGNESITIKFS